MTTKRIIPCLDTTFDESGKAVVVKGIEFESLRYAGDPVELARRYVEQKADELVFLGISASTDGRATMTDVIKRVADGLKLFSDTRIARCAGLKLDKNLFIDQDYFNLRNCCPILKGL